MAVTKIYKLNWCSERSKRPRIAKFSQLIPDNREIYAESGSQQTASTTKRKSLQRSYNEQRPHSALGYLTPAAYPPTSPQRATGCATPNSSADRTSLHPRLMAWNPPRL